MEAVEGDEVVFEYEEVVYFRAQKDMQVLIEKKKFQGRHC